MLPKLEYHPVNWVDGMRISRKHFSDFEYFVSDHLRDTTAASLTSFNYGLLPSDLPDFNLQVISDQNQNLRIQLSNCRAVTGAGCRIELVNKPVELATNLNEILLKYNIPNADELNFLIVLSVNIFARQPEGKPANNEPFPRPPYTLPTYWLSVVPSHQYDPRTLVKGTSDGFTAGEYKSSLFESYHLIVGQVVAKYGQLKNNDAYIPACTSINSHVELITWADQISKILAEIQRDAFLIVEKVIKKRGSQEARKVGPLAELIRALTEQVAISLDDPMNFLRFNGRERPPMELLERITLATRHVKTTLNYMNDRDLTGSLKLGKDLVLPYFQSWTDISPAQLEGAIESVVTYSYNHSHIRPHLDVITRFWQFMQQIFKVMTERQYIGQQNETYTFVDKFTPTDERDLPDETPNSPLKSPYRFTSKD